jgi:hypothetical protein
MLDYPPIRYNFFHLATKHGVAAEGIRRLPAACMKKQADSD